MKHLLRIILAILIFPMETMAYYNVTEAESPERFPILGNSKSAVVYYDNGDFESVKTVAGLLSDDVKRVTGKSLKLKEGKVSGKYAIIIGTIGHNAVIDNLIAQGRLDISGIKGGTEQYTAATIDKPADNVDKALVIAGTDRRGTAYGVFDLSEAIGVPALYWWADAPVKKHKSLYISPVAFQSKRPSVKYRGIFINDEGWGITPWAKNGLDADINDIGPKTYAKVCELILRMKGNMLAPAMHPSSAAFNKYPENAKVADRYGIIMTSSHCEPLLFNNVTEWNKETMGDWNYVTNRRGILDVLDNRVKTNSPFENIYTIAMRGIHDSGIVGVSKENEVALVESVIDDQRGLLTKYIDAPIESIPQIFVPYKEVLDTYERGLRLPDDIILVWPDDNYGYIKRLNDKNERNRRGGSGVYYHISYLGEPHDYLWLNTTPPALMWEEMSKAYENGAKDYWLLNVGDIKPGELGMATFLDMAWNMDRFNSSSINDHQPELLASFFGDKYLKDIKYILDRYYQLGFQHKPEAMGWGWEWNSKRATEKVVDTDFSVTNYNEIESRLESYDEIASIAESILNSLPKELHAPFFELVYYPVKGAGLMNKKMLTAQLSRWHAAKGNAIANHYADMAKACHDSIAAITDEYNSMLGGKWNKMMAQAPGWVATYQNMPPVRTIEVPLTGKLQIAVPGQDHIGANVLPYASPLVEQDAYIDLFNTGKTPISWTITASATWLTPSSEKGTADMHQRIRLDIDWDKVPAGMHTAEIAFMTTSGQKESVFVPVYKPENITKSNLKGLYVEHNGCVSMNAASPSRIFDNDDVKISVLEGLGYDGNCLQLGNANGRHPSTYDLTAACRAEYDFYTFGSGSVTVYAYALPVFPLTSADRTRFGLMIDDGDVKYISNDAKEYSGEWRDNVARNASVKSVTLNVDKPGKHTLKLICADPGMVIQKLVIDMGGMKRSYLGAPSTLVL